MEQNIPIPNEIFENIMEKVGIPKGEIIYHLVKGLPKFSEEESAIVKQELNKYLNSLNK